MAFINIQHPWAFTFGLLGNLISFMVYLAPVPTFWRIYKKKSTEGFQSIPYVVALFSAMLWIYYAFLKTNGYLLITINTFGCVIETVYIVLYITFASRKARIFTAKLILLVNLGVFSIILTLTLLLAKGSNRVRVLGWVCVSFSVSVFAAPLSIMRRVIRTRSVEFMPFSLSFFLTMSAVIWFSYGLLLRDYYIALPNVLGFFFGILQMILYNIYKDPKVTMDEKLPSHVDTVTKFNNKVISEIDAPEAKEAPDTKQVEDVEAGQMNQTERRINMQNNVQLIVCEV